jgi:protein-tyrosine phosphatase
MHGFVAKLNTGVYAKIESCWFNCTIILNIMPMPCKLLFVCLGNICRSPSAENIMNHLVKQAGLSEMILCDSAGTGGYHIGADPDRRMAAAAARRGITLKGQARQFKKADFENFDLILAMDRDNYQDILSLDPSGKYQDKVRLMCDFATHHREKEVPDPYYGGTDGFDQVIDLLLDACEGLQEYVVQNYSVAGKD